MSPSGQYLTTMRTAAVAEKLDGFTACRTTTTRLTPSPESWHVNGMKNSLKCFDVAYMLNLKGIGEFVSKRKLTKNIIKLCKIMGVIKEGQEILVVFPAV